MVGGQKSKNLVNVVCECPRPNDLAYIFFGDLSQSEKLSEIKPPLASVNGWAGSGRHISNLGRLTLVKTSMTNYVHKSS